MRFVTFFIALVLSFSQLVQAADQPSRSVAQDQCVRIIVNDEGNSTSLGSGSLIRDRIVVTCNHVVADRETDIVQVVFPGQGIILGTVIGTDSGLDLAFINLDETPKCKPFAVQVDLTTELSVQGYGSGTYRQRWGTLSDIGTLRGWRVVAKAAARSGDSGGPVLDADGSYVGTLWGSVDGETYFTPANVVIEKLTLIEGQLAARYHSRGNVERFFKRPTGDQIAAGPYHTRKRVKRFFKRATRRRKAVA